MPFALLIIAVLLIVAGARGTVGNLRQLLISDFTGKGNFINWLVAIGVVGAIGYVPGLEKFSRVFILLVICAMVLKARGGVFTNFQAAVAGVQAGNTAANSPAGGSGGDPAATGASGGSTVLGVNTDALSATASAAQSGDVAGTIRGTINSLPSWVADSTDKSVLQGGFNVLEGTRRFLFGELPK